MKIAYKLKYIPWVIILCFYGAYNAYADDPPRFRYGNNCSEVHQWTEKNLLNNLEKIEPTGKGELHLSFSNKAYADHSGNNVFALPIGGTFRSGSGHHVNSIFILEGITRFHASLRYIHEHNPPGSDQGELCYNVVLLPLPE